MCFNTQNNNSSLVPNVDGVILIFRYSGFVKRVSQDISTKSNFGVQCGAILYCATEVLTNSLSSLE